MGRSNALEHRIQQSGKPTLAIRLHHNETNNPFNFISLVIAVSTASSALSFYFKSWMGTHTVSRISVLRHVDDIDVSRANDPDSFFGTRGVTLTFFDCLRTL
jgi:1,4-dihydroxy-2-naphthoate octaprenyltransferase